ncbi:MAG TPA: hypothetical protein VNR11_07200 [Xanthobacteraceae bacterium]|nr:hypothetical protein [Xanthobacteraceae bacterium]
MAAVTTVKREDAAAAATQERRRTRRKRIDDALDEGLKQTFPASDPVALTEPVPPRPDDGT